MLAGGLSWGGGRLEPVCDTVQPDLNASAKATLPGSTEQVPREVQSGEQDRFRGAQHQQEAPEGVAGQKKLGQNGGKNGPGFRWKSQYYSAHVHFGGELPASYAERVFRHKTFPACRN